MARDRVDRVAQPRGEPAELLHASVPDTPGCLILDVRLPGISGLDLQEQLARHGIAVRSTRMSFASPGGFRGATSGQLETAVRLQLRVPMSKIDQIVAILGPEASDVVVRR